jgi:hypothetical protein
MTKTILDTTVWLNFARAEAVDMLITAMAGRCAVGLLVEQQEMLRWPKGTSHASQPFTFQPFIDAGTLELAVMTPAELAAFHETKSRYHLGDGETEAVVIAVARGWRVATDDGAARKRFASHNPPVEITGTIGLLRELLRAVVVSKSKATAMLERMRSRGGRLPDEDI